MLGNHNYIYIVAWHVKMTANNGHERNKRTAEMKFHLTNPENLCLIQNGVPDCRLARTCPRAGPGKSKVVPGLEDMWGSGGIVPLFLTSALDGNEWLASRPDCFTPGTHWRWGWVGPRAGLDFMVKIKILPCWGIEPHVLSVTLSIRKHTR
jgi:hypothetical protein